MMRILVLMTEEKNNNHNRVFVLKDQEKQLNVYILI